MNYSLRLVKPSFDDPLVDLLVDLEKQRTRALITSATTPPEIFIQLKRVFHLMESLGSARIEGNRTTIAQLVDRELESRPETQETVEEILNIEVALGFIERIYAQNPEQFRVNHALIRQLHQVVTQNLSVNREGDATPGQYRNTPVKIAGADHQPPQPSDVFPLMEELQQFLDHPDPQKYDLIKLALAHHRFAWIHPFSNGNGRTVRLLTYALLLKAGFQVGGHPVTTRLLNPTAVFCADRDLYYDHLARADRGDEEGLLSWCRYVLGGLKAELAKVEKLLDWSWLKKHILNPAVEELHEKNGLSVHERTILLTAIQKGFIQNNDVQPHLGGIGNVQVSRIIGELKDRQLLIPLSDKGRKYQIGLAKSPLLRTILRQLDRQGFLPFSGEI